jgi:hypothetical protein
MTESFLQQSEEQLSAVHDMGKTDSLYEQYAESIVDFQSYRAGESLTPRCFYCEEFEFPDFLCWENPPEFVFPFILFLRWKWFLFHLPSIYSSIYPSTHKTLLSIPPSRPPSIPLSISPYISLFDHPITSAHCWSQEYFDTTENFQVQLSLEPGMIEGYSFFKFILYDKM